MWGQTCSWSLAVLAAWGTTNVHAEQQCAVYLAEASSEESDLSISFYAGQAFAKGETIPVVDLGIPMLDWKVQNDQFHQQDLPKTLLGMMWTPGELTAQFEDMSMSTESGGSFVSGLGFAGAHNPGLANMRWNHSAVFHRHQNWDQLLDDRVDAMATAVSDYYGMQMTTLQDVAVGSELFPYPGEEFFDLQEKLHQDDSLTPRSQYTRADFILQEFHQNTLKYPDFYANRTQAYWDLIRHELVQDPKLQQMLPVNVSDIPEYIQVGSLMKNNPNVVRSLEYLQTHGTCADHIEVKPSSIKGAGRGAFAKRLIKKGDIVAPMPLLRLPEEWLLMFDLDVTQQTVAQLLDKKSKLLDAEPAAAQLLMNYVLGHTETSVVFYPFGPGVNYINHASYSLGKEPNVDLEWSTKPYHWGQRFFDMDMDTLQAQDVTPFSNVMDLIATRDIQAGEEILMDYGPSFDEELQAHLGQFQPQPRDDPKANILNADKTSPIRTLEEQKSQPYPTNVDTACFVDLERMVVVNDTTMQLSEKSGVKQYQTPTSLDATEYRCKILKRHYHSNSDLYLVKLWDTGSAVDAEETYVADVPRSAILFVNAPYTSAMHTRGTLRHYIEIPDDLLPDAWRDMQVQYDEDEDEDHLEEDNEDFMDEYGL